MKEIKISKGMTALVDDEDYDKVSKFRWFAVKKGNNYYAQRVNYTNINSELMGKTSIMHRFILGEVDSNIKIDHRDHNTLNNQKNNLRRCTQKQNCINTSSHKGSTSKYRGVYLNNSFKWSAQIKHPNGLRETKTFNSEIEAAKWYNEKAEKSYGEFANLNIILPCVG